MRTATRNATLNNLLPEDRPAHNWYRFVLSFPPHLVRDYLRWFNVTPDQTVLDPFCGTGTTLVECKKHGIASVGIEANPVAHFASRTKTDWSVAPDGLTAIAARVAEQTQQALAAQGVNDDAYALLNGDLPDNLLSLPDASMPLLLTDSISPLPLHKTLVLLRYLQVHADADGYDHARLALAKTLVDDISNLHFGPEVGVGVKKPDAPVIAPWLARVRQMAHDLARLHDHAETASRVLHADARTLELIEPQSIDAVITSPPYPNEKDYTRTTRLESVLLGFIRDKAELRAMKQGLLRSNTRNVYVGDEDDAWIAHFPAIVALADTIEARRIELGKTSGFERLYARTTKLYFGGMARHLANLRPLLRPGAQLAYVVGDQASYLRVMIRTGTLLAEIAESLGYEVVGIDLFRTRLATATREQLREEVVVLRWGG
jgi:SAM-dependent methyltransferase